MSLVAPEMWLDEPLTGALIDKLKGNCFVESREYLRPIFRWSKANSKHYNIGKAFSFAEWMIVLHREGCNILGIKRQVALNPQYALNTLITMSQRSSDASSALKAFGLMKQAGYDPDVFTFTALLDVVGRCSAEYGGLHKALQIYDDMMDTKRCLPNIVTFVTLLRIIGCSPLPSESCGTAAGAAAIILRLLSDAHTLAETQSSQTLRSNPSSTALDLSIYNAALAVSVKIKDPGAMKAVLKVMHYHDSNPSDLTWRILLKMANHVSSEGPKFLEEILTIEYFTEEQVEHFKAYLLSVTNVVADTGGPDGIATSAAAKNIRGSTLSATSTHTYSGCLGADASESLRQSVMQHDTEALLNRLNISIHGGDEQEEGQTFVFGEGEMLDSSSPYALTENDFATLLHQCRKRKWERQVDYIFFFMLDLYTHGYPCLQVKPQVQLRPTRIIFEAMLDAYFSMNMETKAWQLYCQIVRDDFNVDSDVLIHDVDFSFFVIRSFAQCGCANHMVSAYHAMRSGPFPGLPTETLVMGLMRALGRNVVDACEVLADVITIGIFSDEQCNRFVCALIESAAVLANGSECMGLLCGITFTEGSIIVQNTDSSPSFRRVLFEDYSINNYEMGCIDLSLVRSHIASLNRDLRSFLATMQTSGDFIVAVLMAAVSAPDPYIHVKRWCEQNLLLPLSFYYGLLAEATASMAAGQKNVPLLESLPFLSFSLCQSAACKYLHLNRRTFITESIAVADIIYGIGNDLFAACFEIFNTLSLGNDCNLDPCLNHYMKLSCVNENEQVNFMCGCLLVHHINARLVGVKTKNQKVLLINQLQQSLRETFSTVLQDSLVKLARFCRHVICSLSILFIDNSKQAAKLAYIIFGPLVDEIKSIVREETTDLFEEISHFVSDIILSCRPSLDVLRELSKAFNFTHYGVGKRASIDCMLFLLRSEFRDKIVVKVLTHLNDLKDAIAEYRDEIEEILCQIVCADPSSNTSWAALTTYMSFMPVDKRESSACRLARHILGKDGDNVQCKIRKEFSRRFLVKYDAAESTNELKELLFPAVIRECDHNIMTQKNSLRDEELIPCIPVNHVHLVSDINGVRLAVSLLFGDRQTTMVALDVEWRPYSGNTLPTKASLLQIAILSDVLLFDLIAMHSSFWHAEEEHTACVEKEYYQLLQRLFGDPAIVKIGYGIVNDFRRLANSYPAYSNTLYDCARVNPRVDLMAHQSDSSSALPRGLAQLTQSTLGRNIDKSLQCSDWEQRPLTADQIKYAAVDAHVLLQIYQTIANCSNGA